MESYSVLTKLTEITETKETGDTFLFMANETTHEPILLQEPDYVPAEVVDNTEYDEAYKDRFVLDGRTLPVESAWQLSHYDVNMAAMIQLGKWFNYMRECGVYDNSRIILVGDHGKELGVNKNLIMYDGFDAERFYPTLMVKDFDAEGFSYSSEFMTIADVPALALDGLIENPVNPFTGNPINTDPKAEGPVYAFYSEKMGLELNVGNNVFHPGSWYRVDNQDMRIRENWVCVERESVSP